MNGQPIIMSADLPHSGGRSEGGPKANLEVISRRAGRKNVELTVGAIPEEGKELDDLPLSEHRAQQQLPGRLGGRADGRTEETYDLVAAVW